MTREDKMREALEILRLHNNLKNDHDAYLYDIIDWALFDYPKEKPDPKAYGVVQDYV